MGAYNAAVTINISSTDVAKIRDLRVMSNTIGAQSRTNNRLGRYNMFFVKNDLLLDITFFNLK